MFAKFTLLLVLLIIELNFSSKAQAAVGLFGPDRYDGIPEACLLPMDFGHCRAKVKRYYFDMRRMKCAMFYWGGCAGNINNFKSLDECNRVCLDAYIENGNEQQQQTHNAYTVDKKRNNSRTKFSSNINSEANDTKNNNNNSNDYKNVNSTSINNYNTTANIMHSNAGSVPNTYNYKPSKYLLNSMTKKNFDVQKQDESVDYEN